MKMAYQMQVGWKDVGIASSALPLARSGHILVGNASASECFMFGGYNGVKCMNDLHVLTLADEGSPGQWEEIDSLRQDPNRPAPRASHCACACGSEGMFVFGGSGQVFGFSNYNDTFFFSFHTRKWINLDTMTLRRQGRDEPPVPDLFSSIPYGGKRANKSELFELGAKPLPGYGYACIHDPVTDCVLLFGGTSGSMLPFGYWNHFWIYDLKQQRWSMLVGHSGEPPTARYLSKLALFGSKCLIVGGSIPPFCFAHNPIDVFELDLDTLVWSKLRFPNDETVPRVRFAHSLAQLDAPNDDDQQRLFIYGGSARAADPNDAESLSPMHGGNIREYPDATMYEDAWMFSYKRRIWTRCATANSVTDNGPGRLDFHATVALRNGKDIVLFGGFNKTTRVNKAMRLRLQCLIPSLEALCVAELEVLMEVEHEEEEAHD